VKKALVSFLSIVVLLGMVGMAGAYSTSADGGIWTEVFVNGGEGSPGSLITAYSVPFPSAWTLDGLTLTSLTGPSIVNGELMFQTMYTGGILSWFGSPSPLNVNATVYAYKNADDFSYVHGNIILSGGGFTMTGNLTELSPPSDCPGCYNIGDNFDQWYDGHWGLINEVTITTPDVTTTPEPVTLMLLSVGLVGLAGMKRRFKS
jgi:hypothetical protein